MPLTLLPKTANAWANAALGAVLVVVVYTGGVARHADTEIPGPAQAVTLSGATPDRTFGTGAGAYLVTTVRISTSPLGDLFPPAPDAVARYTRGLAGEDAEGALAVDSARAAALRLVDPAGTGHLRAAADRLVPADHGARGPSGGLITALAFVDALTPGDLTGGLVIAGTGAIFPMGQVGEIGGADLKITGAQGQHPDVFFTPSTNELEARSAGTPTPVVGVDTLSEAVAWLCAHGGASTACPSGLQG